MLTIPGTYREGMGGQMMPRFSGSPDLKKEVEAHMAVVGERIVALRDSEAVPAELQELLVHLHDSVVGIGKLAGVGFFD